MAQVSVTIIADQRPGEPDILAGREFIPLEISDNDGRDIRHFDPPETGWTFDSLCEAAELENAIEGGIYDAYFDNGFWIGSTEV